MGNQSAQGVQAPFLNVLRRDKSPVTIFLISGIKLQGVIVGFDNYSILLKNNVTQLIFKHAISTVMPSRELSFFNDPAKTDEHT